MPSWEEFRKRVSSLRREHVLRELQSAGTELLSALLLLAVITAVTVPFEDPPSVPPSDMRLLRIAIAAGFTVHALIEAFPSVVLSPVAVVVLVIQRKLHPLRGFCFVAMELLGAFAGSKLVLLCAPEVAARNFRPLQVNPDVSVWQAFTFEVTVTCVLTTAALALDTPAAAARVVGFGIAAGILAGAYFSGGCMNPLIAFGPAAATNNWENHWIFWAADVAGGVLAMFFVWALGTDFSAAQRHPADDVANTQLPPPKDDASTSTSITIVSEDARM